MKESIQSTPERGLVAFAVVHPIISFALLVSVALGIVVGYVFLLPWLMAHLGGWSPEKSESLNSVRGLFGDSFGALTSF